MLNSYETPSVWMGIYANVISAFDFSKSSPEKQGSRRWIIPLISLSRNLAQEGSQSHWLLVVKISHTHLVANHINVSLLLISSHSFLPWFISLWNSRLRQLFCKLGCLHFQTKGLQKSGGPGRKAEPLPRALTVPLQEWRPAHQQRVGYISALAGHLPCAWLSP